MTRDANVYAARATQLFRPLDLPAEAQRRLLDGELDLHPGGIGAQVVITNEEPALEEADHGDP